MPLSPAHPLAEPILRLAPFVTGVRTAERVVIRRADAPAFLNLTIKELAVVEELRQSPTTVSDFLGRHFAGHKGLDLGGAVSLLMHLYQAKFLADATGETQARHKEVSGKGHGQAEAGVKRLLDGVKTALDLPLVSFHSSDVHPVFRRLGKVIVSWPALIGAVVALFSLGLFSGLVTLPSPDSVGFSFSQPDMLLVKTFFSFSLATSWIAFLQMAALSGAGARFVGGGLRVTGLCVVRLAVDDKDALMLPKTVMLRYHLVTLLTPWVTALALFQLVDAGEFSSLAGLMMGTFVLVGFLMLCPFYRSPLVKIAEGYLATTEFLARANAYLTKGLFVSLFKKDAGKEEDGGTATQLWITAFACFSFLWLYFIVLAFVDATISAVPELWVQMLSPEHLVRAASAGAVLLILGLAVLVPLLGLISIPFRNLAAVASMPLRRARRGVFAFYDKALSPSAVITRFLKEIPILADLGDAELENLTQALKYRRFGAGQNIITKGDDGQEFYILADGQAQVILGGMGVPEEVVDVLNPGDSFGEIAMIERVKRTAGVRALSVCATFVLQRQAFDKLFPEGSEARQRLTTMIRQVKLVLDSSALSHLAPRQIKELLKSCRSVTFNAGDFLIKEDTVGQEAFLVATGEVQVVKEAAAKEIARLGRGELVGAISLIKDIKRTASVRALTDVQALAIDKSTFLRMCMSNMFVALLVSDLADKQLAESRSADAKAS